VRVRLPLSAPPRSELESGLIRRRGGRRECFPVDVLTGKPTGDRHPERHLKRGGVGMTRRSKGEGAIYLRGDHIDYLASVADALSLLITADRSAFRHAQVGAANQVEGDIKL
jgi:hypothetical protein